MKPNNTLCYDALFQMGGLSMESDPSVTNSICPDTIFVPISSGIVMGVHMCLLLISALLLFYKRKNRHITSRGIWYLILTMITSFFYVETAELRFVIGRKIYPCALNSLNMFMLAFAGLLPTIFKCVRIFFMYRLNLETKQVLDNDKGKQLVQLKTEQETKLVELSSVSNPTLASNQSVVNMSLTEELVNGSENNQSVSSTTANNNSTTPQSKEEETQSIPIEQAPPKENLLYFDDILLNYEIFDDNSSTRQTMTDVESTYAPSVMTSGDELTEISIKPHKRIQFYKFILSYKFIVGTYMALCIVHLVLWLILSGIDQIIKDGSNDSSKRLLVLSVGPFDFTRGCIISNNFVFIMAAQTVFYMVIELVFLVLCFFADRDTWFMKGETIIIFSFQVCLGIIYLVVSNLNVIKYLTDYFVTYANTTIIYSVIELFVCVTLPCIYAIVEDYKKSKKEKMNKQEQSIVEIFLNNKKTYEILLDYAIRSYCQESVQCWKDIQKFTKSSKKNRTRIGKFIFNTYLVNNAPVELNLPADLRSNAIVSIESALFQTNQATAATKSKKISKRLFEEIELHCVMDITDVFERLKASNKKVRDTVEKWNKLISKSVVHKE